MGAWYAPEIFVPSEKRILSPAFHGGYFVKRIKALEAILNRWTRRALDDEMLGALFLVGLSPIAFKRCA